MLDNLPRNLALKQDRLFDTFRRVDLDDLVRQIRDSGVDIGGSIAHVEVDLTSPLEIASESSVVLKTVAGSILVNRKSASVLDRVRRTKGLCQFDAGRETLPGIVGLQPPPGTLGPSVDVSGCEKRTR